MDPISLLSMSSIRQLAWKCIFCGNIAYHTTMPLWQYNKLWTQKSECGKWIFNYDFVDEIYDIEKSANNVNTLNQTLFEKS